MAKQSEVKLWTETPVLRDMNFGDLAAEAAELRDTKKAIESRLKEIDEQIKVALIVSGEKGTLYDHYVIDIRKGRSASTLDKQYLLQKGVSADLIAEATKPGTEYEYVMFTDTTPKPKPGEGAADGAQ